jgi:hypothetical protein
LSTGSWSIRVTSSERTATKPNQNRCVSFWRRPFPARGRTYACSSDSPTDILTTDDDPLEVGSESDETPPRRPHSRYADSTLSGGTSCRSMPAGRAWMQSYSSWGSTEEGRSSGQSDPVRQFYCGATPSKLTTCSEGPTSCPPGRLSRRMRGLWSSPYTW